MGGALAVIATLHLRNQGFQVSVTTFGQPKITDLDGAEKMTSLDLMRFADGKDIVPLMPPVDWKPGQTVRPYAHFGREVDLVDSNYECLEQHYKSKDPTVWMGEADKQTLGDHSMVMYKLRISRLIGK